MNRPVRSYEWPLSSLLSGRSYVVQQARFTHVESLVYGFDLNAVMFAIQIQTARSVSLQMVDTGCGVKWRELLHVKPNVLIVDLRIMKLLLYLALLHNTCIFVRAVNNAGSTTEPR